MSSLSAASGAPPIIVDGLTRRYGDFTAVDAVSFEAHPGEIFGFLGPNGAGKTTTIKMLTGLLAPSEGRARVAGFDIGTERTRVRHHIGYMSQKFSLYADLTVDENIQLFSGLYGVTGARYDDRRSWILDMAELTGSEHRLTQDLPLGWKQRLALGCAVVHQPPILFLDEPTSGVDPVARRRFWDLITEMSDSGTTVMVSTHYMEEAEYCHRLALLNRGRLIALDTPRGLRARTAEPILEVGIDDAPAAVAALTGVEGIVDVAMFGRLLHVTVASQDTGPQILRSVLGGAGRSIEQIRPIEPSLEDMFVSLVRAEGGAVVG